MCIAIPAEPDVAGSIVRPVTPEEQAANAAFLQGYRSGMAWGEALAKQLGLSQVALCQ